MGTYRFFPRHWFFLCLLTIACGCATSAVKLSGPLPPVVKEHKHFMLWGGVPGMQDTGVQLARGQLYTILATGSIDCCIYTPSCEYHDVRPEHGWPLLARIGDNPYSSPLVTKTNARTLMALYSGNLHLSYWTGKIDAFGNPLQPHYYKDDSGYFSIDVIVWAEEDWGQMEDFIRKLKEKDPSSKAIDDALLDVSTRREHFVAATYTAKQIDETKKQIEALQEEPKKETQEAVKAHPEKEAITTPEFPKESPKPEIEVAAKTALAQRPQALKEAPPEEAKRQETVKQLEEKLAKLTEKLAQLEEAEKKWQEERTKSIQLAKDLEEREKTEKELRSKLAQPSKGTPVIVVAAPQDAAKVEINIINLAGVAEGEGGLERIEIFINGRPFGKHIGRTPGAHGDPPPKRLEFNERIPLEKGPNRISLRAMGSDGATVEKTLIVHYTERAKNIWAVVIGINGYHKIRQLNYAATDARSFYDYLIQHNRLPEQNVTLLVNQEASLTKLRSILGTDLKNKAGAEDTVIIYFAGHGATEKDAMSPDGDGLEKYLLPYDADPRDLYSSALPMREISHIFNRIRSERLIFIVDSCYSGASGGRTVDLTGARANISDAFLDRVAAGKGRVILTASRANEVSAENDKLKHGVFTYYLLDGLRGKADVDKDGAITVDEIFRYVSIHVPQATGQEQHPVKKGTVEGQLVLGIVN